MYVGGILIFVFRYDTTMECHTLFGGKLSTSSFHVEANQVGVAPGFQPSLRDVHEFYTSTVGIVTSGVIPMEKMLVFEDIPDLLPYQPSNP